VNEATNFFKTDANKSQWGECSCGGVPTAKKGTKEKGGKKKGSKVMDRRTGKNELKIGSSHTRASTASGDVTTM